LYSKHLIKIHNSYIFLLAPAFMYFLEDGEFWSMLIPPLLSIILNLIRFNSLYNKLITSELSPEDKQQLKECEPNKIIAADNQRMMNSLLTTIFLDLMFYYQYIFTITFALKIHTNKDGYKYNMYTIALSYFSDFGGYIGGKLFGATNFGYPITPSKTVEGYIFSIVFGLLSGSCMYYSLLYFYPDLTKIVYLPLYLCIQVPTALIGDFLESLLKRCGNVKDSGTMFDGHGGLLDRTDSFTMCMAITYYFMEK